ncbi:MAG: helix-turn-helix transcriptional regulator [Gammaproteobacteria bacterium]|nr:helix-turn-helix transcriptional regulator [Gammaproteobacteria bacterium]
MVDRSLTSLADGFGERLRAVRLERGLTQRQLADVCQLPHTAVSQFETGARTPGFSRLLRLAAALEVSIDYLAGRTDSRAAHLFSGGEFEALGLSEEDLELLQSIAQRLARDAPAKE